MLSVARSPVDWCADCDDCSVIEGRARRGSCLLFAALRIARVSTLVFRIWALLGCCVLGLGRLRIGLV
ncbi:hypothetical protein F383_37814 [Gossypium arboreum]|uniref:Uncharacterized protein n=1 Tax=Gossypium arboreum TaxID=29729 RepID=A0A0B0ME38_GOSAR|nr:hypothetical protein F383_37814 [Gossypium arboreum]